MPDRPSQSNSPLVALPETRQLDVLAELLLRRGARVVRCPLVAIEDAPDAAPIVDWLRRFCADPPDLFILYTGEGLRRLLGFAARAGIESPFRAALGLTAVLTRGPKPVRALREIDVRPTHRAVRPTTEGVIASLEAMDITGRRVAVQLYGADPNDELMAYLGSRSIEADCVAPYVYASASDERRVIELIESLQNRAIDAIAFTSKSQVERLRAVARRAGRAEALDAALGAMTIAAVGPVVAAELTSAGVRVDVMPEKDFFMKPLVTELLRALGTATGGADRAGSGKAG